MLTIYGMAHVHSQTLSKQLGGAGTSLLIPRVAASARKEAIVLFGSIPAVALYLAVTALGATPSEAAFTALFCLVALLFTMGCLGGSASGAHRGLRAVVQVVGAGLIAALLVIMMALLH